MPTETPTSASGSSTKRSDRYSQLTLPTARNEATKVSNSRLTCTTEEPNSAGSMSLATRRSPACRQSRRGARQQSRAPQPGQLQRELQDAGGEHAPAERVGRLVEQGRAPQHGRDQREVEQRGGDRRQREAPDGVEHAAGHGGERDEQDVREGQAQQVGGERGAAVAGEAEARREGPDQQRRGQHADGGDAEQDRAERAGGGVDQRAQVRGAPFAGLDEHRHESLGESALGGQPAQEVGDAERDEEGVQRAVGVADEDEDGRVAGVAEQPRQRGHRRGGG